VALKKILMHHEKEGVSGHPQPFHDHNWLLSSSLSLLFERSSFLRRSRTRIFYNSKRWQLSEAKVSLIPALLEKLS
jgi:hypothetical protein